MRKHFEDSALYHATAVVATWRFTAGGSVEVLICSQQLDRCSFRNVTENCRVRHHKQFPQYLYKRLPNNLEMFAVVVPMAS